MIPFSIRKECWLVSKELGNCTTANENGSGISGPDLSVLGRVIRSTFRDRSVNWIDSPSRVRSVPNDELSGAGSINQSMATMSDLFWTPCKTSVKGDRNAFFILFIGVNPVPKIGGEKKHGSTDGPMSVLTHEATRPIHRNTTNVGSGIKEFYAAASLRGIFREMHIIGA